MKKCSILLPLTLGFIVVLIVFYLYYYAKWSPMWSQITPYPLYEISQRQDDTIRIVVIGDSWADNHHVVGADSLLEFMVSRHVNRSVICRSSGIGGEKSRSVYQRLFSVKDNGLRPLMYNGVDYGIIFTGINDAQANLGVRQFVYYYKLIIEFMLYNHIRPVIIEIPDINLYKVYGKKPVKDKICDFLRSCMTGCSMYKFRDYRKALFEMLINEGYRNKVLYVKAECWNGGKENIALELFCEDQVHLNKLGYEKLDSCIASMIISDLTCSRYSTSINQPVD